MGRRLHRLASEVAKFLAVGGVATLVALVVFNGLVHGYLGGPGPMHEQPLVAFVIGNLLGMVVSYRGSRSWAFRHREAVGPAGGRLAFFVINIISMAIPLLCLTFSRYVLHLDDPVSDNVSANVIGLALGTAARFWAIRRFIFLHPTKAAARQTMPSRP
ncbi:MAG TPA: GtrA family protein [Nocardioidaceae bacterium]|nr:GtrA family protein [Nocardioidaceae bacterium]